MAFSLSIFVQTLTTIQVFFSTAIFIDNNNALKSIDLPDGITQEHLTGFRSFVSTTPMLRAYMIPQLMQTVNKFSKSGTTAEQSESSVELICLLLIGRTNGALTNPDCSNIFESWFEEKENAANDNSLSSDLTTADFDEAEEKLKAKLSAEQTEEIMGSLRKFHKSNSMGQYAEGIIEILFNGIFLPSDKPEAIAFYKMCTELVKKQLEAEQRKRQ